MHTLAAWLHTLSPDIVRITDSWAIRWYGAAYVAGFGIAFLVLRWMGRRGLTLIPADRAGDALLWLAGGAIIGGRMGYVLFYQPALAVRFSGHFPWWNLLAINEGGMASHGAMIGMTLAAWRVSRGWKDGSGRIVGACPFLHVMDLIPLLAPFGVFLGRLANFVNGELLGAIVVRPGTEGPWWTVQFPQELELPPTHGIPQVPALQQPETAAVLKRLAAEAAPALRFDEALHTLASNAQAWSVPLKPLLSSRHPSQIYQAVAEGVVVGSAVWLVWARPRKPGVIVALGLVIYGVLRVATEVWRLPDPQFVEGRPFGLSRGQWLSVAMIASGVIAALYALRRPAPKLGGWRNPGALRTGH